MNIPNLFTLIRIALIPIFCIFVFDGAKEVTVQYHPDTLIIAGLIFILAAFTDWFDGYFARKYNQITNVGKLLDPLADKLLITSALIAMVEWEWIPGWSVVVILAREFLITGLRSLLLEAKAEVKGASFLGKAKTFIQICSVILFLFDLKTVGLISYYVALVLTVVSGLDYLWQSRKYLKFKENK